MGSFPVSVCCRRKRANPAPSSALNLISCRKPTALKHRLLLFTFLVFVVSVSAQWHLGVFAGGANYLGELNDDPYRRTKPALGLSINCDLSERLSLRSGLTFGGLQGADKYGQTQFVRETRNLSFQSFLSEFSLLGELNVFNLNRINWTPYGFAGVAVFRFNPYVRDGGNKIFLHPLTTEGQGLPGGEGKVYSLTQLAIPFGGGLKFNLNDDLRLGFEVGLRHLFTDYLDDVSTNYPDAGALLAAKGPTAVALSYRGDEVPGENAIYPDNGFPGKGATRGNPKTRDWYYFTGFHLTYRLKAGFGRAGGGKNKFGCPVVPM